MSGDGAERAQLHRARLRRARGARLLRPRPHGGVTARAGRHRLGGASSAGRARAGSTPAASSRRSPTRPRWSRARRCSGASGTAPSSRTTSTTARRSGSRSAGKQRAQEVNRELAKLVDVMLGNEEDFTAALGFEVEGVDRQPLGARPRPTSADDRAGGAGVPNFKVVATTLRTRGRRPSTTGARSASAAGPPRGAAPRSLEIYDRVGGGDSFASGLIYGFLAGRARSGRSSAARPTARWP